MAFTIKRNDDRPAYTLDLKNNPGRPNETPLDLTNATAVTFKMRHPAASAPKTTSTMTITDAAGGRVQHNWQPGDTDTTGTYQVELEITWNDGGAETVPNDGYLTITILDDLDAG